MWFAFSSYVCNAMYCGGMEGVPSLCNLYSRVLSVWYYCHCNMLRYVYLCVFSLFYQTGVYSINPVINSCHFMLYWVMSYVLTY
jgi:hypothetical protein